MDLFFAFVCSKNNSAHLKYFGCPKATLLAEPQFPSYVATYTLFQSATHFARIEIFNSRSGWQWCS